MWQWVTIVELQIAFEVILFFSHLHLQAVLQSPITLNIYIFWLWAEIGEHMEIQGKAVVCTRLVHK